MFSITCIIHIFVIDSYKKCSNTFMYNDSNRKQIINLEANCLKCAQNRFDRQEDSLLRNTLKQQMIDSSACSSMYNVLFDTNISALVRPDRAKSRPPRKSGHLHSLYRIMPAPADGKDKSLNTIWLLFLRAAWNDKLFSIITADDVYDHS